MKHALSLLALVVCLPSLAAEPEYPHGAFRDDCSLCHQAGGWSPAQVSKQFDHSRHGMRLEGAHARVACRACHASLDFARANPQCVSCHQDVHRGELGTDCARCHNPRSFIDRAEMVRAHLETRFPLTGAHLTQDCEDCHLPAPQGQLQFVNRPIECVACHLNAYNAATDPNHVTAGFPTECAQCHGTVSWTLVRFNHSGTQFPLTGAHAATPCESCHGDGVYDGKSTLCVSCHLADYNGTNDPNHQAAGFPTTCETCHTTTTWEGARDVNHDASFFPIYSGKHQGKWSACSDCHTAPTNFAEFNCLLCHEHSDKEEVDDKHRGVSGYAYESHACYGCHPDGRKD